LRLVTVDSIEERMLEIAETKQQQDELVIQQGRYHHDLDLGIDEKRDKLLEILARRNSGQNKDEDLDTLQMERGEDERWLFEKVDRRMDTLGFRKGIDQPVIPPCLLKSSEEIGEECHQNELKLWKEAYQSLDLSYSLKLLVRKSPVVGGSDFEEEIKLKRHKLNEAVFTTMDGCLKQFGWTEKQAPVIYETKTAARNGLFMSLHEVERTLNKVLDFASTSEYLWSFKLVGALNCRVRRLLFPADFLKEASEASSEPEEEEDTEESMDEVLGFTQFLMNE
jgi:hypothetical protein